MRSLLSSAALPLLLALTLPACIGAPGEQESQAVDSRSEAWTDARAVTWGGTSFTDFVASLQIGDVKIQVRDGQGSLIPSVPMNNLLTPAGETPDITKTTMTFSIPGYHHDFGTLAPTVDATVSNLDATNLTVTLLPTSIAVSFDLAGKIFVHESSVYPNFDIQVSPSTFTISLSFHNGALQVDSVTGSVSTEVDNCGFLGWCDDLVGDALPDFSGKVQAGLRQAMNAALVKPSTTSAIDAVLLGFSGHVSDVPKFGVVPASPTIDSAGIEYKITRDLPPTAPTHPSVDVLCGNDVLLTWDANPDTITIIRTDPDGSTSLVPYDGVSVGPTRHDYGPPGNAASYQVCASSYLGQACAAPIWVALPHSACGGTITNPKKTGCTKGPGGKLICYTTG